jgi:hypothetical protein
MDILAQPAMQTKPFLWGPVKSALIQDAKEHGPDTILKLCYEDHQRIKEMMVAVLTDLGRDDPQVIRRILLRFFPDKNEPGTLQRAWHLVRNKGPFESDKQSSSARTIAVEVAGNLGIDEVLKRAALHEDPSARAAAVRFIYHLWQCEPAKGFDILAYVAAQVMHGPVPDPGALETVFGLSLAIFFDYQKDEQVLLRLQAIWRQVINSLFGINENASRLGKVVRDLVRDQVISIAVRYAFHLMKEFPKYNLVTYEDVIAHFKMKPQDKALYKRLNRYIDPAGSYSQEEMEKDLIAAIQLRSILTEGVVWILLAVQLVHHPDTTFPFLKQFFERARSDPVPNPWTLYVAMGVLSMVDYGLKEAVNDEAFQFFIYAAGECQEYYGMHPTVPGMARTVYAGHALLLNDVVSWQYKREGTTRVAWLEQWLKERIAAATTRWVALQERRDAGQLKEEEEEHFFDYVLETELPLIGIEGRLPGCALEVLALFMSECKATPVAEKVDALAVQTLARLRRAYPDQVDDFMEEQSIPQETQLQVRTREPIETVAEVIGGTRTIGFVIDQAINNPTLREEIIKVFSKAADSDNANKWFEYTLREIINLIYGGEALRQISL